MVESFFGSLLAKFFYDSVKDNLKNDTKSQTVIEKQIKEFGDKLDETDKSRLENTIKELKSI